MPITIAFTGLVRRPDVFREQLEAFAALRAEGLVEAVYWSTWYGELDRYPDLHAALQNAGVVLIEAQEPTVYAGPGHFYMQSAAVRRILEQLPPERIVLRLRPDIVFALRTQLRRVVPWLAQQIAAPAAPLAGLSSRVFVGLAASLYPFWLEDRYFAGRAGDLLRLGDSRIDFDHFAHRDMAIAETRWFSRPFVDHYSLIRDTLRINWTLAVDPTVHGPGAAFHELLRRNVDLQRMLAAYHFVLERNFIVGAPSELLAADVRPAEPDPMPMTPDIVAGFSSLPQTGPAYRDALARFRSDPRALNEGLRDEEKLIDELLAFGSALRPAERTRAFGAGLQPCSAAAGFRWGAAPHRTISPANRVMRAEIAWRRVDAAMEIPDVVELRVGWRSDTGPSEQAQLVRLNGLNLPSGEHRVEVRTPRIPGWHTATFSLETLDGRPLATPIERAVHLVAD